jgi:spore germination cell wall hydrolase CwlJ-like protein
MKLKDVTHHTALFMTLILAGILTIFAGITGDNVQAAQTDNTAAAGISDDGTISNQIIISATSYLQLTSCEDIDEAPEVSEAIEPVERMVLDLSDDDIYLIACQVYVEAGAEPYDGMVGVANVIINRVLSDQFPNTVSGVIYQSGQFPPAHNGVLDRVLAKGPGDTCMQATLDALHGVSTVGDYLYFNMARGVNKSRCSRYMQIGDTVFYMP